jgi:hypothetical protein
MPLITEIDLLPELERGRVPAAIARRDKLVELRRDALAMVRADHLVLPHASWRVVALDAAPRACGTLQLAGHRLEVPWLLPASGRLTALAIAVATLGHALEQRVEQLFAARRPALALALDGVGNELLFALSRRVQDRMLAAVRRQGLTMAGELRAGDPGLQMEAQPTVLALAGAADIGVTLTRTLMMNPTKSTSIVQGVGIELPAASWSRCTSCRSRARCAVAQAAA